MSRLITSIPQEVCTEHISGFLDNFSITGFSETCSKWYGALAHIIETRRNASLLRHDPGYHRAPALFLRNFDVDEVKSNVTFHARVISVEKIVEPPGEGGEVAFIVALHDNTPGPNNVMKGTFWNWFQQDFDYLKANMNKMFIIKGLKLTFNSSAANAQYRVLNLHYHDLTFSCMNHYPQQLRNNFYGQYFLSETPRLYAPRSKRTREGDDTL